MERVINKQLLAHLEVSNFLSPHQYGFRPGRSCESALAAFTHALSTSLDNRTSCEIVQDFGKAFKSADHSLLLSKLQQVGISGVRNEKFTFSQHYLILQGLFSRFSTNWKHY